MDPHTRSWLERQVAYLTNPANRFRAYMWMAIFGAAIEFGLAGVILMLKSGNRTWALLPVLLGASYVAVARYYRALAAAAAQR